MKTRVLMATTALAAAVMWTAPTASADADFCNSLGKPQQVRECNCGFNFAPGTQELQDCMAGRPVAPPPTP